MTDKLIGLPISKDLVFINEDKILDKRTGEVYGLDDALSLAVEEEQDSVVKMDDNVEVVVGVEGKKIDLSLANSNGTFPTKNGFLIEVYLSGTDGKLTRVYQEDLVDVLNDNTLEDGFSSYLTLEIDKDE